MHLYREEAVYFEADGESLFGVHTRPEKPDGRGVVLLSGANFPSTNRNRLNVRLARSLAASGSHVFRFDYHGVGDSTGVVEEYRLDQPFVGDLRGALGVLADAGIERFTFVGTCLGARTALTLSGSVVPEALILVSPPVRDFRKGQRAASRLADEWGWRDYLRRATKVRNIRALLDRGKRKEFGQLARAKLDAVRDSRGRGPTMGAASPRFIEPLKGAVKDGVKVLVIYGTEDENYSDFKKACQEGLERVVSAAGDNLSVVTFEGELAGFSRIDTQEIVEEMILGWMGGRVETA